MKLQAMNLDTVVHVQMDIKLEQQLVKILTNVKLDPIAVDMEIV